MVVVSAMSGVTDQLLRIARFACIGDHEAVQQELDAFRQKHVQAICSSSGHHLSFVVEESAVDSVAALLQHDIGTWRVFIRQGLAACACIGSALTAR